VCDVRDRADALLAAGGWIASVQVPPQRVADGVLRLSVVTARLTQVRVRGEPGPYRALLERRIAALRAFDPLNQRRVERLLLLSSDVPGLEVQLSLRPAGTAPGDVVGDLLIAFRRFAVTTAVQNSNARSLGPVSIYSRAEIYGLTGHADLTYLGASVTSDLSEQRVVQAGHLFGLGAGATAGGRFTYAWSRPDLGALDLRTDTLVWGLDLAYPVVRTTNVNLRAALGFDWVDQRTDVGTGADAARLNLDKSRVVFARVSGDLLRRADGRMPGVSLRGGLEMRRGVGLWGATRPFGRDTRALPSRIEGDARATVVRGDLDVVVGVGSALSVLGSARAQWASRPLLAYDEFSIGNLTIGRGYDPGSNSGDRALGLRSEVRFDPPLLHRQTPQLFAFTDAVALTNLDSNSIEVGRHLRSVGGGLRLLFANVLAAELSYAHPLDRALLINRAPPPDRLLFSLIVQARARARG
jgi:hemolysin activation/secretion protein